MPTNFVTTLIVLLVILVTAIFHELSHGLVAYWLGDTTAKDADLYFTSEAITPAYKKEGGKVVTTFIPLYVLNCSVRVPTVRIPNMQSLG